MEPSTSWWGRRPRASVAGLVVVGVLLALLGAAAAVTAVIRLPARGASCNATTAASNVFPALVAVGSENTGTVIRGNGVILTTITSLASGVSPAVTLSDGQRLPATVVGTDSATGLALLKVDRQQLPFLLPSPNESVKAGLPVVTLGSPNTDGSAVLSGTVQESGKPAEVAGQASWMLSQAMTIDQPAVDTNVGAPVVTCDNRMVGVVVGRTTDGTTVAVPAATAHRVISRLLGLS